jgi:hypothetical protein
MEMWNIARTIMYESTVSNQYGSYSLHTPYPGSFRMRAILPAGYKHSPELAVPDTTIDSDINNDGPDAGWTDAFTMQAFVSSSRYDAGFVPTP